MCSDRLKLSIVIPVFNAEKFIRKCIRSVLRQTYPYYEVVIINDGSTDQSLNICNEIKEKDSRILVISQPNSGSAKARRVGIDHATGDYVMFLDADDYFCVKNALEVVCTAIEKTGADLVQFSYQKKLRFVKKVCPCVNAPLLQEHNDFMNNHYPMLLGSYYEGAKITASLYDKAYKRSLFDGVISSSDTRYIFMGDDVYLNLHILRHVQKAYFIPECLYSYQCLTGGTKRFNKHYMEDYDIVKQTQLYFIQELGPQYAWKQDMEYFCHAETAWCMYAYSIDIVRFCSGDREKSVEMIRRCFDYQWIRNAISYFLETSITDSYSPTLEKIHLLTSQNPEAYYEIAEQRKEKKDLKYLVRKFL